MVWIIFSILCSTISCPVYVVIYIENIIAEIVNKMVNSGPSNENFNSYQKINEPVTQKKNYLIYTMVN